MQSMDNISYKPFLLCSVVYIENYFYIQSEVNLHYKWQGMIIGIINSLSIGSTGDSFDLFSVERMLFQWF